MFELWLLSLFYRIIQGIIRFISRRWIFFLLAIMVGVLCSIAVGAFFISLFAFLHHRKELGTFNNKVLISIILLLFGFNLLRSDDYIGMPLLYKATAIGNSAGLLMTVLYIVRFACHHFIHQKRSQWVLASGSILVACLALLFFNHYSHFISYTLANEEDFPAMLQQSKRMKYAADFEALKATHYKLNKHDYYHHDRMQRAYLQRYNNGRDEEDTLIILRFTHGFRLLYYTYDDNGSYQDVVEKPLLDGFNASYNYGNLAYSRDSVFTNMDTFSFEQVKPDGHPIYEETDIELEGIPQTIDDYIAYRERNGTMVRERNMYVSLDYLKSMGIPIRLKEYPKGK